MLAQRTQNSLKEFWRGLAGVISLIPGTFYAPAQWSGVDTTAVKAQQGIEQERLGARLVFGGVYAYGARYYSVQDPKSQLDVQPKFYGVKVGALFPIGVRLDFEVVGECTMFPGWSFTTYVPDYGTFDPTFGWQMIARNSTVPSSAFTGLRMGVRFYPRCFRSDRLVASIRSLKRQLWKRRVNRSGFHAGGVTGPVVGWHKRVTYALPENWPQNEPIPESEVFRGEQPYSRWYWNTSQEVGWTFLGRVDVSIGWLAVVRLGWSPSRSHELASAAYATVYATGSVSCILGRTRLRLQR